MASGEVRPAVDSDDPGRAPAGGGRSVPIAAEAPRGLNPRSRCADFRRMTPFLVVLAVAASLLAGLLVAGVMASRIDNAQRLADLVRETRRLRAVHQAAPTPTPRRRR
jgi:hypothetical protein